MNKKLLFIILSLIFLLSTPSIFAETVKTSQQTIADIPAGTAEEYYNRGNAYKKQGDLTQAIADYTNVIRINSKHAKAYYNRGNIYGKQDNLIQAIADYTKAIEINHKFKEAYYNRGNTYGKQGNLTQAIADYTKAIEIDSKYAAAYGNRGNLCQIQGNFQQAIADYSNAIEINPDIAGFYSNRGNAYQTQGNLHQAIVDYSKSIELNPNDNATYYNRGLAYYGIEQYGSSLADYKNATSKNPNKEAYDDFIKYVPVKNTSDTGNVRNEILQLFAEKLNLDKNTAMQKSASVVDAAPVPVVSTPAPAVVAAPIVTSTSAIANKDLAQISTKQNETKSIPEQDVRNVVLKWAASWESGDMKTYGSFYASNFQSKGMTLNKWISYKTNVHQKSKNITIRINDLQISAEGNSATAVFTQYYSSSILSSKSKKKLELRKINNEWKIYREII
jgi:tetratricopeptide (TPR) repeat protein